MTNYDRIKGMSVEEMAKWLAMHIDNYKAPYDVKEIYRNEIMLQQVRVLYGLRHLNNGLNRRFRNDT